MTIMNGKLNILHDFTSDQQRGDCFGFEGRNVKHAASRRDGARGDALFRVHHAQSRLPALALVDPDRPCCR